MISFVQKKKGAKEEAGDVDTGAEDEGTGSGGGEPFSPLDGTPGGDRLAERLRKNESRGPWLKAS